MKLNIFIFTTFIAVYFILKCDIVYNKVNVPKDLSTFEYRVDNNNDSNFGYFISKEDGLIIGPSSVYLLGEKILITDPLHNNIKCIDLKNGIKTILSPAKSQNKINSKLIDLFVLDSLIYLLKTSEEVEIIDMDGNFKGKLVIPSKAKRRYYGNKIIYGCTDTTFSIHLESDFKQNEDFSFKLKLWNINKSGQLKEIDQNINEYNYYELKSRNIRGKRESIDFEFEKMVLKNQWGRFKLTNKPLKVNYWENNNFDFTSNRVVIMEVNKSQLVIYSYLY